MKAAVAVLLTVLLGAVAAEAAWWPTKKLPKPIDSPVVRPKVRERHKPGNVAKHPPGYQGASVLAPETAARA